MSDKEPDYFDRKGPKYLKLKGEWYWYGSLDGERYDIGPYKTRSELLAEIKRTGYGEYKAEDGKYRLKFIIAECRKDGIDLSDWFDLDRIIEDVSNHMEESNLGSDESGENHPLEDITNEQMDDLSVSIKNCIRDWQFRHNLRLEPWPFTEVRNVETIDVPHPDEES